LSRDTFLVVGLGASGRAALDLVAAIGARGLATDDKSCPEGLADSADYLSMDAALAVLDEVSCVVTSPGVPASHRLLTAACERGIAIRSELDFAAGFVEAPIVAVSGTNGKSTVTTLLGRMLECEAYRTFVGGNLGRPLSLAAAPLGGCYDYCVVEVSSFQLEWSNTLHPRIATVLNISPDHLDRHATLDNYIATKMRLFARMCEDDQAVFGRGQAWWPPLVSALAASRSTFGSAHLDSGDSGTVAQIDGRRIVAYPAVSATEPCWELVLGEGWPQVPHDFDNACAAAQLASLAGVGARAIERALAGFDGLEFRLRCVGSHAGVTFWNDSKATNVGATLSSLEAFEQPVILLAGGVAKGADFSPLATAAAVLSRVVVYGEAAETLASALEGRVGLVRAAGLDEAFAAACECASGGDAVLLAPACASFDEFANYVERGRRFNQLVAGIDDGVGDASTV